MQNMKRKCRPAISFLVLCFTCSCRPAAAQVSSGDGIQQFAEFGDFKLRDAGVIHEFRMGYRTMGKLNSSKSNAVLWPTWIGGKSRDLLPLVGPGNVIDTGNYFVVLVDGIGNGISSSPSNSKRQPLMKYPQFTDVTWWKRSIGCVQMSSTCRICTPWSEVQWAECKRSSGL